MRRIQIQKKKAPQMTSRLAGQWKPIAELPARSSSIRLSDQETFELEQRRRLESLIMEHATA